jgi:hypothetical protein
MHNYCHLLRAGLLNTAGVTGELGAAQWLRLHGAEWPFVLGEALKGCWTARLLRWARAEGCTAVESTEQGANAEEARNQAAAARHRSRLTLPLD